MGYRDKLVLADRAMGLLGRSIEKAGLWDRSLILVTVDHEWRAAFWRSAPGRTSAEAGAIHTDTSAVPFLLKLPGQTSGAVYNKPLPAVVMRRLTEPAAIPCTIARIEAEMP